MKSTGIPTTATDLRLFSLNDEADIAPIRSNSADISVQIPFLPKLTKQFEAVTGWQLSYTESRKSYLDRTRAAHNPATCTGPIDGTLAITDLSRAVESGKPTQHRGMCDELVKTLDEMVGIVQAERRNLIDADRRLSPVVDLPFEWWSMVGKTGCQFGRMSAWSITSDEKIRVFVAELTAGNAIDSTIACSTVLGAFEATSQASVEFFDVAQVIPHVAKLAVNETARLEWFATVELDPITGEFCVDGFESSNSVSIIDLQAGALINWNAEEANEAPGNEALYSGQVLAIGTDQQQREALSEIIANTELTTMDFRKLVERRFADSAALFLYRD